MVLSALPVKNYASVEEALVAIDAAREHQTNPWPDVQKVDAGGRSVEEWLCLLQNYQNKLMAVYSECDGSTVEGRARMTKYAALQANLALWLVQATLGLSKKDKQ